MTNAMLRACGVAMAGLLLSGCGAAATTGGAPVSSPPPPAASPTTPAVPQGGTDAPAECALDSALVGHLTVPDGSAVASGSVIEKTWRLANTGCAAWPEGTELIHLEGDLAPAAQSTTVRPVVSGGTAEASVSLTAPSEPGDHRTAWQLRAPDGRQFGTVVTATVTVPDAGATTPGPTFTLAPMPVPPEILFPGGFVIPTPSPPSPSSAPPAAGTDEVRRKASLRIDLLVEDRDTLSANESEELIFIEPSIVLTSLRPTDRYTHELCAGGEAKVVVVTDLSMVDSVVHARTTATLKVGSSCVTATPVDTMVWSLVAGDGQTVSTTGWGSGSGGGYDIAISLTNEPWSP